MSLEDSACIFCRKFGRGEGKAWYDEEFYRDSDFAVVPALGPFEAGYMMLVTLGHYRAFAELPEQLRDRGIQLVGSLKSSLKRAYRRDVIMFEHGASRTSPVGSCIDHAHLHVMPSIRGVARSLIEQNNLARISLSELEGASYLFVEDEEGGRYGRSIETLPGQYVRRVVSSAMGCGDEWDYLVFPRFDLVRATIEKMRGYQHEW